jgi:hypothetical protein
MLRTAMMPCTQNAAHACLAPSDSFSPFPDMPHICTSRVRSAAENATASSLHTAAAEALPWPTDCRACSSHWRSGWDKTSSSHAAGRWMVVFAAEAEGARLEAKRPAESAKPKVRLRSQVRMALISTTASAHKACFGGGRCKLLGWVDRGHRQV